MAALEVANTAVLSTNERGVLTGVYEPSGNKYVHVFMVSACIILFMFSAIFSTISGNWGVLLQCAIVAGVVGVQGSFPAIIWHDKGELKKETLRSYCRGLQ